MPQLTQLIAGGMEGECKQIQRQQQIGQALMSVSEVVLHMIAVVFRAPCKGAFLWQVRNLPNNCRSGW